MSGVQPIESRASMSGEYESKSWTMLRDGVVAAQCRAVRPSCYEPCSRPHPHPRIAATINFEAALGMVAEAVRAKSPREERRVIGT